MLLLLFLGGTAVTLIPGVYLAVKDTPELSNFGALIASGSAKVLPGLTNLASTLHLPGTAGSTITPTASGKAPDPGPVVATKSKESKQQNTASQVRIVDQAVATLNQQLEKDPRNPTLHNRLGIIYAELGEMDEAEAQFRQAVLLSKANIQELLAAVEQAKISGDLNQAGQLTVSISAMRLELSSAHSNLARVFEKLGDNRKVVSQLDELNRDVTIGGGLSHTQDSNKGEKLRPEVVKGLARAGAQMQIGRFSEAIRELNVVLSVEPDLVAAHEALGQAAMATNNYYLAEQELKKCLSLQPKASTYAMLGNIYQQRGKLKEASQAYVSALALNGGDANTAFNLGNIYATQSNNGKAIDAYKRALAANPQMAAAQNNIASIYTSIGQYQKAIEHFEKAIALAPTMGSARYGMGLALYHQGDYINAGKEFKQAIALDPSLTDAQLKAQECYRKAGLAHTQSKTTVNF